MTTAVSVPVDASEHIGLVCAVVKRFVPFGEPIEDSEVFAEGCIGLVRAAQSFDPTRGYQFSTWATCCIRSNVFTWYKYQKKFGRIASVDYPVEYLSRLPEKCQSLLQERGLDPDWLKVAIADLPDRERRIMELRFEGLLFRDIAKLIGVSRQRTHQIYLLAERKIRAMAPVRVS